jgi:superfamily II DNA or RNA helicase
MTSVVHELQSSSDQANEGLEHSKPDPVLYSPQDELKLHQLTQARFWAQQVKQPSDSVVQSTSQKDEQQEPCAPDNWELTGGLVLHNWQQRCVDAWFENGKRGVIKVVTGAGKTILALGIAERLQRDERQLSIAVVVPTTILLHQWRSVLGRHSNLPPTAFGLLGGGHNDELGGGIRVLICVLNSASKKLPAIVEKAGVAETLLLIVDECHRAGAAQMKQVFRTKRKYNLGLSATPERDDPIEQEESINLDSDRELATIPFEDSTVGRELGDVIFEMNYAEAIQLGVLPPFRIVHYGLSLLPTEREKYESLSSEIKGIRSELETTKRRGLALIRWCRSKAAANNPKAARLISLTGERKRLLYRIQERSVAVLRILQEAFEQNPNTRAILFHESIDEVMDLFAMLRTKGFDVVAEHSKFPDDVRAESLRLFSDGLARVIVSAKSLIEGFDVPSADLGIIVAASSSVRQRVQTLGRLLRKVNREGGEKQATLYVLYASQTVDELIYEKADWNQFVGAERNEYFLLSEAKTSELLPQDRPPRAPKTNDLSIEAASLTPGDFYPGDIDEGKSYSLDTQGNVSDETGMFLKPNPELRKILEYSRKKGGRFRVTPEKRFVIELTKNNDGWKGIYLGQLSQSLELAEAQGPSDEPQHQYLPGDRYPLGQAKGKSFSVLQRDKRLIAVKKGDSIRFVVEPTSIDNVDEREALVKIQSFLTQVYANGHRISKITVTDKGHVVYVYNNEAYFVGNAPRGPEGFSFD